MHCWGRACLILSPHARLQTATDRQGLFGVGHPNPSCSPSQKRESASLVTWWAGLYCGIIPGHSAHQTSTRMAPGGLPSTKPTWHHHGSRRKGHCLWLDKNRIKSYINIISCLLILPAVCNHSGLKWVSTFHVTKQGSPGSQVQTCYLRFSYSFCRLCHVSVQIGGFMSPSPVPPLCSFTSTILEPARGSPL